jgi:hypothetical protein
VGGAEDTNGEQCSVGGVVDGDCSDRDTALCEKFKKAISFTMGQYGMTNLKNTQQKKFTMERVSTMNENLQASEQSSTTNRHHPTASKPQEHR